MDYGQDINPGCRVRLSPHLDLWARGATTGRVLACRKGIVTIRMDNTRVRRPVRIKIEDLKRIT